MSGAVKMSRSASSLEPSPGRLAIPARSSSTAQSPTAPPRKLMDNSRLNALGWQPQVPLEISLDAAYQDFLRHEAIS